jgi:hypothetical protein
VWCVGAESARRAGRRGNRFPRVPHLVHEKLGEPFGGVRDHEPAERGEIAPRKPSGVATLREIESDKERVSGQECRRAFPLLTASPEPDRLARRFPSLNRSSGLSLHG